MNKVNVDSAGCWRWTGFRMKNGYGTLSHEKKRWLAHRFSYTRHIGPIPDGMMVLHRCDVRDCVNPAHLFLGTAADNTADMVAKGRGDGGSSPGEKNPAAKLTAEDIAYIRASPATPRVIKALFGISHAHLWRIRNGISWKVGADK